MSEVRKIETAAQADEIQDKWEEFVADWIPSHLDENGRMESGGWDKIMNRGERYLNLDLGDSIESAGYKRLVSLTKKVKKEMDE